MRRFCFRYAFLLRDTKGLLRKFFGLIIYSDPAGTVDAEEPVLSLSKDVLCVPQKEGVFKEGEAKAFVSSVKTFVSFVVKKLARRASPFDKLRAGSG